MLVPSPPIRRKHGERHPPATPWQVAPGPSARACREQWSDVGQAAFPVPRAATPRGDDIPTGVEPTTGATRPPARDRATAAAAGVAAPVTDDVNEADNATDAPAPFSAAPTGASAPGAPARRGPGTLSTPARVRTSAPGRRVFGARLGGRHKGRDGRGRDNRPRSKGAGGGKRRHQRATPADRQ